MNIRDGCIFLFGDSVELFQAWSFYECCVQLEFWTPFCAPRAPCSPALGSSWGLVFSARAPLAASFLLTLLPGLPPPYPAPHRGSGAPLTQPPARGHVERYLATHSFTHTCMHSCLCQQLLQTGLRCCRGVDHPEKKAILSRQMQIPTPARSAHTEPLSLTAAGSAPEGDELGGGSHGSEPLGFLLFPPPRINLCGEGCLGALLLLKVKEKMEIEQRNETNWRILPTIWCDIQGLSND